MFFVRGKILGSRFDASKRKIRSGSSTTKMRMVRVLPTSLLWVNKTHLIRARVGLRELDGDPSALRHDALDELAAGPDNRVVDLGRDGDILREKNQFRITFPTGYLSTEELCQKNYLTIFLKYVKCKTF